MLIALTQDFRYHLRFLLINGYVCCWALAQVQVRKMEQQLHQKEDMGEVLHVVDFDQLKIENQQYLDKIEERNSELLRLKTTTGKAVQVQVAYRTAARMVFVRINTRRTCVLLCCKAHKQSLRCRCSVVPNIIKLYSQQEETVECGS